MKNTIWVERYRPRKIEDVIFQDENQRAKFQSFVDSGDLPHLFLYGVQGTGKSTISGALINELGIGRGDVLRVNCSDEKIDAIRNKVSDFAMSMPMGPFKVVQLEEIDYLSLDAQALLRSLIEDASSTCRFIATCNYANKVIPALQSRFQKHEFKAPDKNQLVLKMADILDLERIHYEAEDILTFVDVGYPDIRAIIQLLQSNSSNGKLTIPTSSSAIGEDWKFGLLPLISNGDFKAARKLVCSSISREEHEDVYRFLFDNVDKLNVKDHESAIIVIAEHLKSHAFVADTEINLAACMIHLSRC